tara:strand:- start:1027 stop:1275 length:249 start_codon:yes stop_codon:yes gene_type:complete
LSNRLIDIIGNEHIKEDMEYKNKIIPKLFKLYNLIGNKIPRHTEDLEFVDDLTKDLEDNPHHRASKLELEYCNKLWKKYKNA